MEPTVTISLQDHETLKSMKKHLTNPGQNIVVSDGLGKRYFLKKKDLIIQELTEAIDLVRIENRSLFQENLRLSSNKEKNKWYKFWQ